MSDRGVHNLPAGSTSDIQTYQDNHKCSGGYQRE